MFEGQAVRVVKQRSYTVTGTYVRLRSIDSVYRGYMGTFVTAMAMGT